MSHPVWEEDDLLPEQLVLSDLINRVLDKGVVIHSHITISLADVDLVDIDLRLLVYSVAAAQRRSGDHGANAPVRTDDVR